MNESITRTLAILPAQPGVYLMRDAAGAIIYVGKAKMLRNRVRSYFSGSKEGKTAFLVAHIDSIEFIVTSSEYEALILENNLIKQHRPRWNINLKDDKTYPMIRITAEDFPRVFRTRRHIDDGSQYFGPFPAIGAIDQYLSVIEEHFPLRKCRGELRKREQPCLYYHIGRCLGPCAGKASVKEYRRQVRQVRRLLEGKVDSLVGPLEKRMTAAAKALRFEQAAKLRDAVRAIRTVSAGQQVQDFDTDSRDYLAWASDGESASLAVFRMRDGKLVGSETFRGADLPEQELAEQFFTQFYEAPRPLPQFVYLMSWPSDAEESESPDTVLGRWLRETRGAEAAIALPESARDRSIINMARENARQDLVRRRTEEGDVHALRDLQAVLGLDRPPLRIEGFDIAHLHGKHTVAAMVSFWKGIPDKNRYRIFKIRSLAGGIDDFESIREAVARRYSRVLNEELERPDLIVIDGGKGQLSATCSILESLGLGELKVCALAKEEEEIFLPGRSESIRLPEGSPALRILQAVRDESHRFGTGHNQRLRSGDIKLSTLEGIPGIGPTRAKKLLEAFGSLEAIRQASAAAIARRADLPAALAGVVEAALRETSSVGDEDDEGSDVLSSD